MKVVGLMSGTSADGVDAALVDIVRRGETLRITPLAFTSAPYPPALQQRVVELSMQAQVAEICHMNAYLGELFAKAALRVIRRAKDRAADIDARIVEAARSLRPDIKVIVVDRYHNFDDAVFEHHPVDLKVKSYEEVGRRILTYIYDMK